MIREQLTARNPLRILEKTLSGGLRPGGLGLVLAPAGVGIPIDLRASISALFSSGILRKSSTGSFSFSR